jgi:GR25 family glycosyltransferase involved in LPS biosynthesis
MINNTYIVHYAPLTDRKERLTNELMIHGITEYDFITEYDRNTTSPELMKQYFKLDNLTPAQICITISHIEIYRKIVDNNFKLCLILEDDAILDVNFKEKLDLYLKNLPDDFDIGFLNDGCGFHADNINDTQIWYKKSYSRTCCSYLITYDTCKRLLESIIPFNLAIDHELNTQISNLKLNTYWAEPTIVTDGSGKIYTSSYVYY